VPLPLTAACTGSAPPMVALFTRSGSASAP
jgi:hypothetical protein